MESRNRQAKVHRIFGQGSPNRRFHPKLNPQAKEGGGGGKGGPPWPLVELASPVAALVRVALERAEAEVGLRDLPWARVSHHCPTHMRYVDTCHAAPLRSIGTLKWLNWSIVTRPTAAHFSMLQQNGRRTSCAMPAQPSEKTRSSSPSGACSHGAARVSLAEHDSNVSTIAV
jgi:hypothetical protein